MRPLSNYLLEQASWRRDVARAYPEDPRNPRAADSFERWADWLEALPEDHEVIDGLTKLERAWPTNLDIFIVCDEVNLWLSPYVFHRAPLDERDFGMLTWNIITDQGEFLLSDQFAEIADNPFAITMLNALVNYNRNRARRNSPA